jgi:hypothetical protein
VIISVQSKPPWDREGLVEKLVPEHDPMGTEMIYAKALALEIAKKSHSLEEFVEKLRTLTDLEHKDKVRKEALLFLLPKSEILLRKQAKKS